MVPVMEPSPAGGISITIGPSSLVLKNGFRSITSGFGVSVWIFESSSRDRSTI